MLFKASHILKIYIIAKYGSETKWALTNTRDLCLSSSAFRNIPDVDKNPVNDIIRYVFFISN